MGGSSCIDITDEGMLLALPPCADPGFDHRTCDYWEDADRGSKAARLSWLSSAPAAPSRTPALDPANPFAPTPSEGPLNPFRRPGPAATPGALLDDDAEDGGWNPFAPVPAAPRPVREGVPRKLALLDRGRGVFGSYARVLLVDGTPVAYAQFGPLSAYPRAGRLRELYPRLPDTPLPAVITCIATRADARSQGHARRLVEDVCRELAARGFAAVEAYPDLTRPADETSAAVPAFWVRCGFIVAVDDQRFPVLRRELG